MSQIIPVDVSRLTETNENKIAETVKLVEQKMLEVLKKSKMLKCEVENLQHENLVLDKKIACNDFLNKQTEKEILELKTKTEEAACSLEKIKWEIYKTELLKEFENKGHELALQKISTQGELVDSTQHITGVNYLRDEHRLIYDNLQNSCKMSEKEKLKKKIKELTEEIERKKNVIEETGPKLYKEIQVLENRNAAMLKRYERQVLEVQSRHRQALLELKRLKKISAEKTAILFNQNK